MTAKTPVAHVEKALYGNFLRKAMEYRDTRRQSMAEKRWNAASLNAIHAGISGNDALLVYHHGMRSISPKHDDAVKLLKTLMKDPHAAQAANHLLKLIFAKNLVSYESRLFTHEEACGVTKAAERFLDYVTTLLPGK